MCGICGVVQIGGEPRRVIAPEVLDRMTDAMTHRGPNDRGTHLGAGVALGARRLSIVDVAGGHQPVSSEDGHVWAVQNGELYNHLELRDELGSDGHTFASACDTEVIPHLYEHCGPAFAERLRGKFAIALWDEAERRAVLARDRLGIKPLYHATVGDVVVFASELKSLLASGLVAPELDYEAVEAYLTLGFVPGPRTPLAGVATLLPGHRLVVDPSGARVEQYWAYPRPQEDPERSEAEWAEGFLAELEESVRLRLMSDVPLGAMLSGGLDSTVVVGLMARNMSEPVKTFSIGFAEDGADNELADARHVAEVFGTDHHELELSYLQETVDLAELVWHLDEPVADLSALGFHALSQLAARHVTVALSGQGADELLGGYRKHVAAALVGSWNRILGPAAPLGGALARLAPPRFERASRALAAADPAERLLAASGHLDEKLRAELVRGPLAAQESGAGRRAVLARLNGFEAGALPTMLYLDGQLAMVDDMLHYFDRTSMAHSLEVRVPFLDHRVVEYCAEIPSGLKVRRLNRKYLLKRAARGLVPERILKKRKLGFFRHASTRWLQAQMPGAVTDYLQGSSPRCAEFLDRRVLDRLIAGHRSGSDTGHVHLLISVLMLEIWLATYLPRAVGAHVGVRERIALQL